MSKIFKRAFSKQEKLTKKTFLVIQLTIALLLSGIFVANATIDNSKTAEENSNQMIQQTKTVKGTVKDSNGDPLPGVTVLIQGTTTGTVTNVDGDYELTNIPDNATLVFSFVGMQAQSIVVGTQSAINVTMEDESIGIEEVVAIGYGTMKKSDLTGSVSSVSSKDIKNYAVPNVSQLMTGKASGVYVASNSGQPGDASIVRIRGLGTVNDNNPLYIVDGQPFENVNDLNPSDIDHVEVLKDASACAIYGSRGSNGVILVTTKKGKNGKAIVSFDTYVGIKNSCNSVDMCNSEQFYNYITQAYANGGEVLNSKFEQQYLRGYDTNWWDAVNQTGVTQNYNVSIQKGDDKSKSYFSLGYLDDKGAIITSKFSRITMKLNNEYKLSSFLSVGVNMGITKMRTKDLSSLSSFSQVLDPDPFTPVINPLVDSNDDNYKYNKYAPTEWAFNPNPVADLRINDVSSDDFDVYGNVYADLKISSDFSYHVQFNFEKATNRYEEYNPAYESVFSEYNLANQEDKYRDESVVTNEDCFTWNYVLEQQINYNKKIDNHLFGAMIAATYESNETKTTEASKTTTAGNDEAFRVLDAATADATASGSKEETSLLSYLGRLNYSYDNRYLATISFRADGSSKFSKDNRWGYFPSFSLGWRVNNEEFFNNLSWTKNISNLKLRIGWGQNGNQRIDSDAAITTIGTSDEDIYFTGGEDSYNQGYGPSNMGNSDIKWETSEQTNIGIDAGFFDEKISISLNYYMKKTEDMLLEVPIPAFAGYTNYPWQNAGNVKNTGMEITVNYRNQIGQLHYSLMGNASFYKNKVTSLGADNEPLYGSVSKTEVGGPMSRFYGYVWKGIFKNQTEIDNYVGENGDLIQPYAVPGDAKFADLDNNGSIDDDDRTYIGNPHPDLIYGFNISLSYKNFDFSAFFQGTVGNDIYNGTKAGYCTPGNQNALADAYTKAWKEDGDNASYPRISTTDDNDNFKTSTWYVEDGSFLRLQNVQLGYNLPSSVFKKINLFSSCRFYISGQNLFTLTGYSGLDPEIGSDDALDMGYDETRYPSSRTIMIGANIKF